MWGKLHADIPSSEGGKLLIELSQMPVRATHRIGMCPFGQFCVQQVFLQAAPRAADPGLEIYDDLVEVYQASRDQWPQRILARRRIATRARHKPRGADLVAVELREA